MHLLYIMCHYPCHELLKCEPRPTQSWRTQHCYYYYYFVQSEKTLLQSTGGRQAWVGTSAKTKNWEKKGPHDERAAG
jgi:hypothetical protein